MNHGKNDGDWLGIPGLSPELPIDQVMDVIALDVLRPLAPVEIDIDPVKYEIAAHRIGALLREGTAALARTSSSPLVTECGEYVVTLYDAEGHAAYVTAGVLPHLTGTENGIKYTRHCYSKDREGIHPGDQFVLNDPYLLGMHTPDMLVARPIFSGDEVVAWVGSLTHTIEIGAKDPGGTADSTDIFQEGLRVPCLKLVSRGEPVEHVFRLLGRAVRSPAHLMLDVTAKIASNNVAAARLEEMVAQEGPAFVRGVLRKLIQESEVKARERIRQVPDGRWQVRVYADHNGREATPIWLQLAAEKKGDGIHFDFAGSSDQCPGPVNLPLPGTIGALFSVLVSVLFPDLQWNRGVVSGSSIHVPKGCLYNPRYPAACYASAPGPATLLSSAATRLVSEMAMAGGLTGCVCAPWNGNFNSVFMGGIDQYGELQGTLTMDSNGGGTGGTPFADGDDTAAYMLAPGAFMSDVEMYEANYPLLYLFRRQRRDSCGYGQWRGGLGGESAVAIHGSDGWRVGFRGLGIQMTCTHGLFGGYPAESSDVGIIRGVRPQEKSPAQYRALLASYGALAAAGCPEKVEAMTPPRPMAPGDAYYLAWPGGGGYGDPLLRDPERVAADWGAGLVSAERCRDTYGVILGESGAVDGAATAEFRSALRSRRLAESSVQGPEAAAIFAGGDRRPVHAVLALATVNGERWIACGRCGLGLGPAGGGYWQRVAVRTRFPKEVGHDRVRSEWMIYREYCCPGCGILLAVEPTHPDDPHPSGMVLR